MAKHFKDLKFKVLNLLRFIHSLVDFQKRFELIGINQRFHLKKKAFTEKKFYDRAQNLPEGTSWAIHKHLN